jgi:hypothetical protein
MALVLSKYTGSIEVKDNGGNTSVRTYHLRSATIGDALTDMVAIVARLNPVTDGVISGYRVSAVYEEDAFAYPAEGVQVQNQAQVVGLIDGHIAKFHRLTIPAPDQDIFVSDSGPGADIVDVTNAALLTYLAGFEATGEAYISDGEDWGQITEGKRIHIKSKKG